MHVGFLIQFSIKLRIPLPLASTINTKLNKKKVYFQLKHKPVQHIQLQTLVVLFVKTLFAIIIFLFSQTKLDGRDEEKYWCRADEQFPDEVLEEATDWACRNGADCSEIEPGGCCYLPNTVKDHASCAFNSYHQRMKLLGGTCYFNAAAILNGLDPSQGSCKFE